jgi:fatty-acyl-CoA synthase
VYPIDFLYRSAQTSPNALAVDDGQRRLTYAETVLRVQALAVGLQAVSRKTRPKIGVCGYNTLEQFLTLMAIHACGGIVIPLNPRNARAELDTVVERIRPDVVVIDLEVAGACSPRKGMVMIGGHGHTGPDSVDALLKAHRGEQPNWPSVERNDVNGIKLTGGSSGVPKGVNQSFRCINTLVVSILMTFDFPTGSVYLCAAPITHAAGSFVLPTLACGGCVLLLEKPSGNKILDALEHGGIGYTWVTPTQIYTILQSGKGREPRFPGLKGLLFGGAPMPLEKVREARSFFHGCLGTIYGQTEASTIVTGLTPFQMADDANLGSVGRATPLTKVEIWSPSGDSLPPGEMGEVVVSGDLVMNGYFEMPDETAQVFSDGWLHTGDIGTFDERGYLFLRSRLRDVIISGGFNVYPSDVESVLVKHNAVYECVVFGAPDEKWGERVEAAVQLRPGYDIDPASIVAFARAELGSVKAPKMVHLVDELPRSAVGKVQRRQAKAIFVKEES